MNNTRARKPGGGRKPSKPEYSASKNLARQMEAAAELYTDKMSLQAIADALSLNPIKVRSSEAAHHSRGLRARHGKTRPADL